MPIAPGGSFPQTSNNRTLETLAREIADHDAGGNSQVRRDRAKESIRDAVREFNDVMWVFCRVTTDITLAATSDGALAEFDLPTNFRTPLRAVFLDTLDREVESLPWVPVEEKLKGWPQEQSTTNKPQVYMAFNVHTQGKVRYWPRLIGTFTWPKVRHYYFRRIVHPTGPDDVLNVPEEVENAIFMLAVAKFLAKQIGAANPNTRAAQAEADDARLRVQREWRDFGDIY